MTWLVPTTAATCWRSLRFFEGFSSIKFGNKFVVVVVITIGCAVVVCTYCLFR